MAELEALLEFAKSTAIEGGKLTKKYFQKDLLFEKKKDGSLVTSADREVERFIRNRIELKYPAHSIVGEEFGSNPGGMETYKWIIDPIDGTRAFVHGVPLFGTLIGLEIDGEIQVGVAHFPLIGETVFAARGLGCWWNDHRAYVSKTTCLADALVLHASATAFYDYGCEAAWIRIQKAANRCAGWGDAYGYALIASGRADLILNPNMSVWDCAPFPVIFDEAGGFFGDWKGNKTIHAGEAIATNNILLPEVLSILQR